jgi:hypothetical protein
MHWDFVFDITDDVVFWSWEKCWHFFLLNLQAIDFKTGWGIHNSTKIFFTTLSCRVLFAFVLVLFYCLGLSLNLHTNLIFQLDFQTRFPKCSSANLKKSFFKALKPCSCLGSLKRWLIFHRQITRSWSWAFTRYYSHSQEIKAFFFV